MSALYPLFKQLMLEGDVSLMDDTVRLQLVDGAYGYNPAHLYLSDVPSGVRRGAATALTSKTTNLPERGVFDAADTQIGSVPAGDPITSYVLYVDTGTEASSPLVAYVDGFYLEPLGGPVLIQHDDDDDRIFRLATV
jgi:hypothetical protein